MNTKFKWLWLWALGLLALLGVWIILTSPDAARPASIHKVAAEAGALIGYSLFAALIAAAIRFLTGASWNLHQWANVAVVLTLTVVIVRGSPSKSVTGAQETFAAPVVTATEVGANPIRRSPPIHLELFAEVAECGRWVAGRSARNRGADAAEYWIMGFLGSKAIERKVDFLEKVDEKAVFLWLDKYCKEFPLSSPTAGAEKLSRELALLIATP